MINVEEKSIKNGRGDYLVLKSKNDKMALYQVVNSNYDSKDVFFMAIVEENEFEVKGLRGGKGWEAAGKYIKGKDAATDAFREATSNDNFNQYYGV